MIRILLLFSVFFISSCGDSVDKIHNQGGRLTSDNVYSFKFVAIRNINVVHGVSSANVCLPGSFNGCWNLIFSNDISNYTNDDIVNIDIENNKVVSISSVWFTTKIGYYLTDWLFGRNVAIFVGRYVTLPFILLFILGVFAERHERKKGFGDQRNHNNG